MRVAEGPVEMTWDPEARIALLSFTSDANATGRHADALIRALAEWIGKEGKPFALLGDGGRLSGLDASYRKAWGDFYKDHRKDSYLAFYNMKPLIRLAAEMFRLGTGLPLGTFATEAEARAWLREKGIRA